MDNDFYNNKKSRKKKENANNYLVKVMVVQMILSIIVTGIMFAVCSGDTALAKNVKTIYSQVCEQDIAVSKIIGKIKDVVKHTFSPTIQEENTTDEITESITGEELDFSPVFNVGGVSYGF